MADQIPQGETLARRLRAARALAGLTVEELAARIDHRGLGIGPLKAIEQCRRACSRNEAVLIAQACGLPFRFMTVEPIAEAFAPAASPVAVVDPLVALAARVDALYVHLGIEGAP